MHISIESIFKDFRIAEGFWTIWSIRNIWYELQRCTNQLWYSFIYNMLIHSLHCDLSSIDILKSFNWTWILLWFEIWYSRAAPQLGDGWCTGDCRWARWEDQVIKIWAQTHHPDQGDNQLQNSEDSSIQLQTKVREDFTIMKKSPSPGWKHLLVLQHLRHY